MELVNKNNFNQVVNDNDTVVVDIYADWCGPCKMISPVLEQLSVEMPTVKFIKVDADVDQALINNFGVRSIPTILFFKSGELKQTLVGFQPKDRMKSIIEAII